MGGLLKRTMLRLLLLFSELCRILPVHSAFTSTHIAPYLCAPYLKLVFYFDCAIMGTARCPKYNWHYFACMQIIAFHLHCYIHACWLFIRCFNNVCKLRDCACLWCSFPQILSLQFYLSFKCSLCFIYFNSSFIAAVRNLVWLCFFTATNLFTHTCFLNKHVVCQEGMKCFFCHDFLCRSHTCGKKQRAI